MVQTAAMLSRLLHFLRGRSIRVPDTQAIPDGEARKLEIGDPLAGGHSVLLCRVNGKLLALDDRCPHEKGGRLSAGPLVEGRWARCPLHGFLFDPNGGRERSGGCGAARTCRVSEEGGGARLWL